MSALPTDRKKCPRKIRFQIPAIIRLRLERIKPALPLLIGGRMNLGQFTETKLLIPRLFNDRPEGAIWELAKRLEVAGRIQHTPAFVEAAIRREAELATFLDGVALPHGRGAAVQQLSLAVGFSTVGIPWAGNHRECAHALFLIAVPLTEAGTYLRLMSGLAWLIQNQTALAALMRATQPEEMLRILASVQVVRPENRPAAVL